MAKRKGPADMTKEELIDKYDRHRVARNRAMDALEGLHAELLHRAEENKGVVQTLVGYAVVTYDTVKEKDKVTIQRLVDDGTIPVTVKRRPKLGVVRYSVPVSRRTK